MVPRYHDLGRESLKKLGWLVKSWTMNLNESSWFYYKCVESLLPSYLLKRRRYRAWALILRSWVRRVWNSWQCFWSASQFWDHESALGRFGESRGSFESAWNSWRRQRNPCLGLVGLHCQNCRDWVDTLSSTTPGELHPWWDRVTQSLGSRKDGRWKTRSVRLQRCELLQVINPGVMHEMYSCS